jgi:hypothetical protein
MKSRRDYFMVIKSPGITGNSSMSTRDLTEFAIIVVDRQRDNGASLWHQVRRSPPKPGGTVHVPQARSHPLLEPSVQPLLAFEERSYL